MALRREGVTTAALPVRLGEATPECDVASECDVARESAGARRKGVTGRSLPATAAGGGWHRERPRAMGLGPRVPRPTLLAKPPGEPRSGLRARPGDSGRAESGKSRSCGAGRSGGHLLPRAPCARASLGASCPCARHSAGLPLSPSSLPFTQGGRQDGSHHIRQRAGRGLWAGRARTPAQGL